MTMFVVKFNHIQLEGQVYESMNYHMNNVAGLEVKPTPTGKEDSMFTQPSGPTLIHGTE